MQSSAHFCHCPLMRHEYQADCAGHLRVHITPDSELLLAEHTAMGAKGRGLKEGGVGGIGGCGVIGGSVGGRMKMSM